MEAHGTPFVSVRRTVVLFGAVGIAWQVVVVALAFRYAGTMKTVLRDLGVDMPTSTRLFLASYQWWAIVPVIAAMVLALVAKRSDSSPRSAVAAAVISWLVGAVLQAWTNEAVLAPVLIIMQKVG